MTRECLQYFQEDPTRSWILVAFVRKYQSLGYAGGSIRMSHPDSRQIESLEGLLGKNYHGKTSITISAALLQKALDNSRFQGIQLEELLKEFHRGELRSKKVLAREEKEREEEFFKRILADSQSGYGRDWLSALLESGEGTYSYLRGKYRVDASACEALLHSVVQAVSQLPALRGEYRYLPVFAAEITGNPHYFDEGQEARRLLEDGIAYFIQRGFAREESMEENHVNSVSAGKERGKEGSRHIQIRGSILGLTAAEVRYQRLIMAGILKNDISNYITVWGIRAQRGDGEWHAGIEGFHQEDEPVNLALRTILRLGQIRCRDSILYVVENPSIFLKMIDKKEEDMGKSLLCLSGQPNMAALLFLDKVVEQGGSIAYSGDFDPEGLLIAEHLKQRYQEALSFFNMDFVCYQDAMSEQEIAQRRLRMLDKLTNPELREIAERMRISKRAGYQERILDRF